MEGEPEVANDDCNQSLPPPKKRGRKKVAKAKQVKRSKERGKYCKSSIGAGDADLNDCLFSDDEIRNEYQALQGEQDSSYQLSQYDSSDPSTSVDSNQSSNTSTLSLSLTGSDFSRPSSSLSSKPSDFSRPSSSLSSRPPSAFSRPASALEGSDIVDTELMPQEQSGVEVEQCNPSIELIRKGLNMFQNLLPSPWVAIADKDGFHVLMISTKTPKTIQREIFVSFNGNSQIFMHCKVVPSFKRLFQLDSHSVIRFSENNVQEFCDFCLGLVKTFLQYEVCIGVNETQSMKVVNNISGAVIDLNPYQEEKYNETVRSVTCSIIIILGRGKRCSECAKLNKKILQRRDFLLASSAKPCTSNKNLTHEQALNKLEILHQEIRKKDKKIAWLQSRVISLLETQGVNIDEDLNDIFSRIVMQSEKLTDVQKMFLQEQWSSAHKSNSKCHRWHPSMIRFALSIYMKGSGNYNAIRDLGILRLPHSRTLFDYAHSIKATDGINEGLVKLVAERVEQLDEPVKELHVLLADGMHVSQNLVYKVSDGTLVGFAKMDDIDQELEKLENFIAGKDPTTNEKHLATEVLAYMVKGMASDVKCVVASYPMKVLSKTQFYKWSWDVIRHMEVAGIKILAFVCDGHPVNRAFIQMHTPKSTDTKFGGVFDTYNFCATDSRLLFFVSDICHLLKTLRNSFYNSGESPKKPRLLTLNGEIIVWKFIVRLYFTYKNDNFRKSYKLSALNVFPNSYSRMKVNPAAQVLSNTVAQDLEDQKWPGTKETVRFIRLCNRFFDCLNGAHSSQAIRQNKKDLAPYTADNITYELTEGRFKFLRDFIDYLAEWKAEVDSLPIHSTDKEKMVLPMQTMLGVEISIRAIEGATVYFLDPNKGQGKFLNARIFSQDPLEHHFGVQRCGGGGSRNPNVSQFQQKQVTTALQRGLNVRKRRGNSAEAGDVGMVVTDEPVAKKARYTKRK